MCLELLEGLEGMHVGVGVVEAHHEADGHEVVLVEMVEEGTAVGVCVGQRPAYRVLDTPGGVLLRLTISGDSVSGAKDESVSNN